MNEYHFVVQIYKSANDKYPGWHDIGIPFPPGCLDDAVEFARDLRDQGTKSRIREIRTTTIWDSVIYENYPDWDDYMVFVEGEWIKRDQI